MKNDNAQPPSILTGPLIGVDFGDYRLGFAYCPSSLSQVFPLADLILPKPKSLNSNFGAMLNHLTKLIKDYRANGVVVGMPLNMDRSLGLAAEKVVTFITYLRERLSVPVWAGDERLTSFSSRESRQNPHSAAAAQMLDQFLNDSACRLAY